MEYSQQLQQSSVGRPPQHRLAVDGRNAGGPVRQVPPTAQIAIATATAASPPVQHYHSHYYDATATTPSQRSTRSLPRPTVTDSPFLSPPPTTSSSARATRTTVATPRNLYRQHNNRMMSYGSPFQSPPTGIPGKRTTRQTLPQPLILDPSARNQSHSTPGHYSHSTSSRHSNPQSQSIKMATPQSSSSAASDMAHTFLQVATGRIYPTSSSSSPSPRQPNLSDTGVHATPAVMMGSQETAASLARSAPKAGYLQKLGQNIPEFKRRFFVLQTETNLYYYLSPNDLEPRGKIPLEGTQIHEWEELPDGRYRFVIQDDSSNARRIVLEARSKELGDEWMKPLQQERVSYFKDQVQDLSSQIQRQQFQIAELEQQVQDFKLVEKDRDGALDDARQWKEQFHRLDGALRLLTQRMRQPPEAFLKQKKQEETTIDGEEALTTKEDHVEEKKEMEPLDTHLTKENPNYDTFRHQIHDDEADDDMVHNSTDETPTKNNQSNKVQKELPSSLLDTAFHAVDDTVMEDIEEIMSVPGTYFSGLADACQQQRDSLRLAAEEAATAVDDVQEAQAQVQGMEQRMERAEKHLTKLWEENCTIRKALKQKKREKRVLVREYKVLQQTNQQLQEEAKQAAVRVAPPTTHVTCRHVSSFGKENEVARPMEETILGSDEERLIDELEDHVVTSMRMNQRLLRKNEFPLDSESEAELNTSVDDSEAVGEELRDLAQSQTVGTVAETTTTTTTPAEKSYNQSAQISPRLASLIDEEDSDEEEKSSEGDDDLSVNEYQSMMSPSGVSSVGAEFGSVAEFSQHSTPSIPQVESIDSTPDRPNPALQLDRDDHETDAYDQQPTLCSASTQSQSTTSKSIVTDYGQANTRLSCPLADVVERKGFSESSAEIDTDMSVYHLTFYSRKIGIQFQKAPPSPVKPKGVLTGAFTADLNGEAHGSDKTAAELRNVAAIASLASGRNARNEEVCPVALPKDAVLVCGFHGFDDSGMNQKPKLGARLVAFDGVSVEIGPWTFDSIRKAIQASGRPLTLSFRNDFLTTEQRSVLTQAVMEVDAKCPPPRPTVQFGARPPSTTPSVTSALSHDTECFVNGDDEGGKPIEFQVPENDLSAWAQEKDNCCHEKFAAASQTVSSHYGRFRRHSASSHSTNQSNFRSFSEAGSSITSNLAPLVANLVKQTSERKRQEAGKFTPKYLQRGESLENTPQHQDFQSNLL